MLVMLRQVASISKARMLFSDSALRLIATVIVVISVGSAQAQDRPQAIVDVGVIDVRSGESFRARRS